MFRFLRRIANIIATKLRKIEIIVFNANLKRRGTVHSVCDRGTLGRAARRRTTIHSVREVRSDQQHYNLILFPKKLIYIIPSSLACFNFH